MRTLLQRYR